MKSNQLLIDKLFKLGELKLKPNENVFNSRREGPIKILARLNLVDEKRAAQALADDMGIEFWDLASPEICGKITPQEFKSKVDASFLWSIHATPLLRVNGVTKAAFANPLDYEAIKTLDFTLQEKIVPVIAEEHKIRAILEEHFPLSKLDLATLSELHGTEQAVEIIGNTAKEQDLDQLDTDSPPVVRLCNRIMAEAVSAGASDIHIESGQHSVEIRYRIDGVMHNIMEIPRQFQNYVISRLKILAGMDISERRKPQDGRMRIRCDGDVIDLRVSTVPVAHGEKIVMRLLVSDPQRIVLANLGMPDELYQSLTQALQRFGQLILVTGPTGSGKTTTLYAILNQLRDGTTNIETVEDPIEYRVPGVHQIQVNPAADVTFANALRSILRQDPDVIMIGEIRDEETTAIALQAAQTGHLVLSTLHTNDAPSSIARLIQLGADRFTLASSLGGILAQRLVRKICCKCRRELNEEEWTQWRTTIDRMGLSTYKLHKGHGCEECRFTGYKGRAGLYSFLQVTPEVAALISSGASIAQIAEAASKKGYRDLTTSSCELMKAGITSLEEVLPYLREGSGNETLKRGTIIASASDSAQQPAEPILHFHNTVLLLETKSTMREALGISLDKEGLRVLAPCSPEETLEMIASEKFNLVLLDADFPMLKEQGFVERLTGAVKERAAVTLLLQRTGYMLNQPLLGLLNPKKTLSTHKSAAMVAQDIADLLKP